MGSFISFTSSIQTSVGRILTVLVLAQFVSGCNVLGLKAPWDREPMPDYDLIAANLVNSLSQFPHLNPSIATVQVVKSRSDFSQHVRDELDDKGFKLETVSGDEGLNQVKPLIKRIDTDIGEQNVYVLSIGKISVERAYAVVSDKTVPVSEQVIRGADERLVALNDEIFEAPDSSYRSVSFKAYDGPQIDDVLAAAQPSKAINRFWNRTKQNAVKKNIYETMNSNYKDVFAGYEDVSQSILIFPNDSLRLGEANKQIIEQYVDQMDLNTDLLSVIGCSHGNTEIANGNSLLALGRANRVKEALLFSGLEHDHILEEGCWAPQPFDDVMPRRGVVLTLKRQKKS